MSVRLTIRPGRGTRSPRRLRAPRLGCTAKLRQIPNRLRLFLERPSWSASRSTILQKSP